MAHMRRLIPLLVVAALLGCDESDTYRYLDTPCDPAADPCPEAGVCAAQDAPRLEWACEPGPGADPGQPCDRHSDCQSGWCLGEPESMGSPVAQEAGSVPTCALGCTEDAGCPGASRCVPLGDGGYGVCLVTDVL